MASITARTSIGTVRMGVGLVSLLAPDTSARVFGVAPEHADAWITRLFGSREVVLAATTLAARGPQARPVALLGAAIDGLDVISSCVELRRGRLGAWTAVSGGGGAVLFVALGLLAAREP